MYDIVSDLLQIPEEASEPVVFATILFSVLILITTVDLVYRIFKNLFKKGNDF